MNRPQKSPQRARAAARGYIDHEYLLLDLVHAVAGFALRGLDLHRVLFGGGRGETADAMGLPVTGPHHLGQGRPLGPSDQRQEVGE